MNNKMAADCISLVSKKMKQDGMTRDDYYQALIALHNKYPMPGHNPPLTTFQIQNYMKLKEVVRDEKTGVMYGDHLQPLNFLEAAEMYKQSLNKRDEDARGMNWRRKEWPSKPERIRDKKLESTGELEEVPF